MGNVLFDSDGEPMYMGWPDPSNPHPEPELDIGNGDKKKKS